MIKKLIALPFLLVLLLTQPACEEVVNGILLGGADIPWSKIQINMFPRNRTGGDLATQMADIKSLGITSIRVTFWFDTQYMASAASAPDFSQFDEVVSAANNAGVEIVAILAYIPDWLVGSSSWKTTFTNSYVIPVVGRYASSIKYWEIWNEPDELTYGVLNGSASDYFDLVTTVAPVIRGIDGGAIILSAATVNITADGTAKWDWTRELINLGLKNYVDILNFHYYADKEFELGPIGGPLIADAGMTAWVTESGKFGHANQKSWFDDNMRFIDKNMAPQRIYWYTYIEGAGPSQAVAAESTYGLVTYATGVRQESPLYSFFKTH